MSSTIRIAGAMLAPLALGACGLPIGVQIASLFADGVSYLTTDKSLTDHGISAVTGEDCALWRGVEGANICHEPASDKEAETIVAALGKPKAPTTAPIVTAAARAAMRIVVRAVMSPRSSWGWVVPRSPWWP